MEIRGSPPGIHITFKRQGWTWGEEDCNVARLEEEAEDGVIGVVGSHLREVAFGQ
jgi:hypothetical protein